MKSKVPKILEQSRVKKGALASTKECGFNGMFYIKCRRYILTVMASDQMGWDHVSVSLPNRTPTWAEMCFVKDLFFDDEETVIQFHPPKSEYVNFHPYVLHLWRPHDTKIQLPPSIMVGPK